MKKIISVIFAAGLFLLGTLTVTSQSWSLPQDNSPKEVIDWATPDIGMKPFEGIYKGKAKNYPYDDIYEDRNGTYKVRIPNKFLGTGLSPKSKTTWAIGTPDPAAGYTEVTLSYVTNWHKSKSERTLWSKYWEPGDGLLKIKNNVVINGKTVFKANETYMCYSTDGSYKENITFEQSPSVQFIYDIDSALYYQVVRARNDSGNSLILWGIFSTSGRYAN